MKSLYKLIKTNDSVSVCILRMVLAIVIFPHGAQKLFGWFGGAGFNGTIDHWYQWWGMPSILTVLVIIAESVGAILLLIGALTRIVAVAYAIIMLYAVYLLHWKQGFFMNWYGQPKGEGFEYHLLVLGIITILLLNGGGKWSADAELMKKMEKK